LSSFPLSIPTAPRILILFVLYSPSIFVMFLINFLFTSLHLLLVLFYFIFSCSFSYFRPSCCFIVLLSFFHFTLSLIVLSSQTSWHILFKASLLYTEFLYTIPLLDCIRRLE
jgi:hypothetical protein